MSKHCLGHLGKSKWDTVGSSKHLPALREGPFQDHQHGMGVTCLWPQLYLHPRTCPTTSQEALGGWKASLDVSSHLALLCASVIGVEVVISPSQSQCLRPMNGMVPPRGTPRTSEETPLFLLVRILGAILHNDTSFSPQPQKCLRPWDCQCPLLG